MRDGREKSRPFVFYNDRVSILLAKTAAAVEPPIGMAEVIRLFGDPSRFRRQDGTLGPEWEAANIVRVKLPEPIAYVDGGVVRQIAIHRLLADNIAATMNEIHEHPELWADLTPYGGSFEPRLKRDSTSISLHTWGIAIDFNPNKYPLRSTKRMPENTITIFRSHGWFYGGDFRRPDPMHFQYATGV